MATVNYEHAGLSYTFTLDDTQDDDERLIISVVRKVDHYAEWESVIVKDNTDTLLVAQKLIIEPDTFQIKYSARAKFRMISDYIQGTLDDMHTLSFPDKYNTSENLCITIKATPKYAKSANIVMIVSPKKIPEVELLHKNFAIYKDHISQQFTVLEQQLRAAEFEIVTLKKTVVTLEDRLESMNTTCVVGTCAVGISTLVVQNEPKRSLLGFTLW